MESPKPAMVIETRLSKPRNYRIDDIQRVDGNSKANELDRFFKSISQRSMALQFGQIQHKWPNERNETRVEDLCTAISSPDPKVRSRIHSKPRDISKHLHLFGSNPNEKGIIYRGITSGIKQLVLEELYKKQLYKQSSDSEPVQPAALSAAAAMSVKAFRDLKFEDILPFIDLILSSDAQVFTHKNGNVRLSQAILTVSDWVTELQEDYDLLATQGCSLTTEKTTKTNDKERYAFADNERPHKRLRLSSESLAGARQPSQFSLSPLDVVNASEEPRVLPSIDVSTPALDEFISSVPTEHDMWICEEIYASSFPRIAP